MAWRCLCGAIRPHLSAGLLSYGRFRRLVASAHWPAHSRQRRSTSRRHLHLHQCRPPLDRHLLVVPGRTSLALSHWRGVGVGAAQGSRRRGDCRACPCCPAPGRRNRTSGTRVASCSDCTFGPSLRTARTVFTAVSRGVSCSVGARGRAAGLAVVAASAAASVGEQSRLFCVGSAHHRGLCGRVALPARALPDRRAAAPGAQVCPGWRHGRCHLPNQPVRSCGFEPAD